MSVTLGPANSDRPSNKLQKVTMERDLLQFVPRERCPIGIRSGGPLLRDRIISSFQISAMVRSAGGRPSGKSFYAGFATLLPLI